MVDCRVREENRDCGAFSCGVVDAAVDELSGVVAAGYTRTTMEPTEIQARATIAAALILSRAVEVPSIPTTGDWLQDTAALRLRDLTDYVYQMITSSKNR
jgi:hypothetical protein